MIKITEQQAIEMLMSLEYFINCYNIIEKWKEKGYIKKSAKEEFEEYSGKILCDSRNPVNQKVCDIINLAHAAIEEEYQRGFADGCKVKVL